MKSNKSKLILAVLILLFIGALLLCKVYFLQQTISELTPLNQTPVSLASGIEMKESLKISHDGKYRVWLNFDKTGELKDLECKLLLNEDKTYCSGIESLLDIDWQVSSGGDVIIAEGNSSQFTSGDYGITVRKEIGEFEAETGTGYEFKMHVNKDALDLNNLNPRLEIGLHPLDYEQDMNTAAVLLMLSYLSFGVAGLFVVILLMFKWAKL